MGARALHAGSRRLGPVLLTSALVAVGWTTGIPVGLLWRTFRERRSPAGAPALWPACG